MPLARQHLSKACATMMWLRLGDRYESLSFDRVTRNTPFVLMRPRRAQASYL